MISFLHCRGNLSKTQKFWCFLRLVPKPVLVEKITYHIFVVHSVHCNAMAYYDAFIIKEAENSDRTTSSLNVLELCDE